VRERARAMPGERYFFFAFFAPFFAGFFAAFFVAFFFTAICYLLETWSRRRTSKTNAD